MLKDRIEIISSRLLDTERQLVEEMRRVGEELGLGLGWHYLLDLTWAAEQLNPTTDGMCVLDAGAGLGVMQWWLAEQGVDVISADRQSRRHFPMRFRHRYRIQGYRKEDLAPRPNLYDFLPSLSPRRWHLYPQKLIMSLRHLRYKPEMASVRGTVFIYNQDLKSMTDIPDESVDAVVSISALEHNQPDNLRTVVKELMRVLKTGGKLIATLGAAKDEDWFHEASKGWCYTEETLRDIFKLNPECPSNYDQYDELFEALCNCRELRDILLISISNLAIMVCRGGFGTLSISRSAW